MGKELSLNILEIAKKVQKLEEAGGGGGSTDSAKRADIAADFSTEVTYTSGVMVYYQGELWQFDETHSAGAWIGTDAHKTTVADAILSSGGGGGKTVYLNNGKIGQTDPAEYITNCPLDVDLPLTGSLILITVRDGSNTATSFAEWTGSNITVRVGDFELYIYADHVGLPNYSGSYRDIYCDIKGF